MSRIRQAGAVAYRRVKPEPLFLVLTSRKDPSKWIFPKGHLEPGEDPAACAVRELDEEAGVAGRAIRPLDTLSFRSGDEDVDVTYYLVEARNEGERRESRQLRWLPAAEAQTLLSYDSARELLAKAAVEVGKRRRPRWLGRGLLALLLAIVVPLLLLTRFFTEIPELFVGSGPSMEPTIRPGEYFTVTAPVGELERGMLVIFRFTHEDTVYHVLRRLAALPRDTIAMRAGRAIVNGQPMGWPFRILEPRASHSALAQVPDLYSWGSIVVPLGSVYLLSDTRDIVGWPDSRFIGPVRVELLEGKAGRYLWTRPGRMLRALH